MKGPKRRALALLAALISCMGCLALAGCSESGYTGPQIAGIRYRQIDYLGGFTEEYLFDFQANTASKRSYLPEEGEEAPPYREFASFTAAEAAAFLDQSSACGLFSLKEEYRSPDIVMDGGGWHLTIEYADGSIRSSRGDNASPGDVFQKSKFAFYELCGDGVVGAIPQSYLFPPSLSFSFHYKIGEQNFSSNGVARVSRANFLWNGNQVSGLSCFELNQESAKDNEFRAGCEYELVLYTANYGDSERFSSCTLTAFDADPALSNPTEIFCEPWFSQKTVPLVLGKIYVYKLTWADGDYAEYTFSTCPGADAETSRA